MYPHLLDDFAARSVGLSLADFTYSQQSSAARPRRGPRLARRTVRLDLAMAAVAVGAAPSVVLLLQRLG